MNHSVSNLIILVELMIGEKFQNMDDTDSEGKQTAKKREPIS